VLYMWRRWLWRADDRDQAERVVLGVEDDKHADLRVERRFGRLGEHGACTDAIDFTRWSGGLQAWLRR